MAQHVHIPESEPEPEKAKRGLSILGHAMD